MITFRQRHPSVPLALLLSVLLLTMFGQSPMLTVPAFAGAVLFLTAIGIRGLSPDSGSTLKSVLGYLILWILVTVTNPLFSTGGATPLAFVNGRPYTLEALLYGAHLGTMLIAVLLWFRCERSLVPEENRFFLFGRIAPKLALLISTVLRFVPLLRRRAAAMRNAQTAVGVYDDPDWLNRTKSHMTTMSALTTWSLEHAIDAGASMKARGYGLPGRTTYRTCRFGAKDALCMIAVVALTAVTVLSLARGGLHYDWYPSITTKRPDGIDRAGVIAFSILCLMPFLSYLKEEIRWSFYRSKM
ncbi:MAG: hypothetical protein IJM57_07265 [Lachnospiraceae bacterium]|nr:hypothetical protein [Lachnospiraceae bacterium]